MPGYFDGYEKQFAEARPPISKRYNLEGSHTVVIAMTKMVKPRNPGGADKFVCEMYTLKSTNPNQEAGAKTSQVINMAWDGSLRDIMSLIAGASGTRFEEVKPAHANIVVDVQRDAEGNAIVDAFGKPIQRNPLKGQIALVRCWYKYKEEDTDRLNPFTIHEWSAVTPEQSKGFADAAAKYLATYQG